MRRKGQFMIISAIIIGLIIMTLAGSVSNISSQSFESRTAKYDLNMIKKEAERLDLTNSNDRERLERTLSLMNSYTTDVEYWESRNCVNVTLNRVGEQYKLKCIN